MFKLQFRNLAFIAVLDGQQRTISLLYIAKANVVLWILFFGFMQILIKRTHSHTFNSTDIVYIKYNRIDIE